MNEVILDYVNMTLRDKLKTIRKERNLSLKKLAIMSGISYNTLIAIERRRRCDINPQLETVVKIAGFYKLTLDQLIEGTTFKE
ncbi:MAG: helix-turn-helix transcriptional regulator [Candidatus Dojkabacteria bacterium]|nr:helix-turn-helix transcriptional regulator [Candidatus Dojkabacteria bacterium]MDQ7021120.1 helix-turn-helix transcriptional regulator [Candidatus Dojkabacteria bacterium]